MAGLTSTIAAALVSLATVEAAAWFWMHPRGAGPDELVLNYRPEEGNPETGNGARGSGNNDQGKPAPDTSSDQQSSIAATPAPTFTFTTLPELYSKAAPMLRCSSGQVFRVDSDDALSLHCAFFKWDGSDTGGVLEAFRHMPEVCMGSIGMILVSKEKPIAYSVDGETLLFDHTVFREPTQGGRVVFGSPLIRAFRAVWVSGVNNADARGGLDGDEFDRLRTIRLKSALTRFRPAHARVIQGAVRGAANGDTAWKAFREAMLKDLKFEP